MRILIVTTKVPFITGGAEILANSLCTKLQSAGHQVDIIAIPFKWYPANAIPEHMLACQLLDLSESCGSKIDQVIGLKFPAYLIPHQKKIFWLLHQHRDAYDMWNNVESGLRNLPNGSHVKEAIHLADRQAFSESQGVFTISKNVSCRLKKFCNINSKPLYHPPQDADLFSCAKSEEYFFFPSRLTSVKRQELVLQALSYTNEKVVVYFAGQADNPSYSNSLKMMASNLKIEEKVKWLGPINDSEKHECYARSLAVIYPPVDEDYGYVSLEAMLSNKPVITCIDSGGVLEFIEHNINGWVVHPDPKMLAAILDYVWQNRYQAKVFGQAGRDIYNQLQISWQTVIEHLVA